MREIASLPEGRTPLHAKENIIGVSAQLWTETIRCFDHVTYSVFPKVCGVFERGWNASPAWEGTAWTNITARCFPTKCHIMKVWASPTGKEDKNCPIDIFFTIFLKKDAKQFASLNFLRTFAIPFGKHAEIAQLVEHNLAKVGVASSSLVFRSKTGHLRMTFDFEKDFGSSNITRRGSIICQSSLCTRRLFLYEAIAIISCFGSAADILLILCGNQPVFTHPPCQRLIRSPFTSWRRFRTRP